MKRYQKSIGFNLTSVDPENFTVKGVFSTSDEDRQGERIAKGSWILDEYMLNPVVMFGHDHGRPVIGKCIELGYDENGDLAGTIQFAAKEYDFAMTIFKLYEGSYMRAFSVGFNSMDVTMEEDVVVLRQNVLYEISAVNVGANAYALAKSKGIDTTPLEKYNSEREKYGRVLSAKNRDAVSKARDALQSVLDADDSDKSITPQKIGRTPLVKNKRAVAVSLINKAVRNLLEGKKAIR